MSCFVGHTPVICWLFPCFVGCHPHFAGAPGFSWGLNEVLQGFNCASGSDAKVTSLDVLLHGLMLGTATPSEVGVKASLYRTNNDGQLFMTA